MQAASEAHVSNTRSRALPKTSFSAALQPTHNPLNNSINSNVCRQTCRHLPPPHSPAPLRHTNQNSVQLGRPHEPELTAHRGRANVQGQRARFLPAGAAAHNSQGTIPLLPPAAPVQPRNVTPLRAQANRNEHFDAGLMKKMGEQGLLGATLQGHGCAGVNYVTWPPVAASLPPNCHNLSLPSIPSLRLVLLISFADTASLRAKWSAWTPATGPPQRSNHYRIAVSFNLPFSSGRP
jgi:hypothetical protein